jgi:ADP-ribose pyrophosphatase
MSLRTVYDGSIVRLDVEDVVLPNGTELRLEIVRHRGAAAVVPVEESGEVILVRQYRHAARESWLLEVPAGKLDGGEEASACALRELEEEAGVRASRLDPLGWIWTTPGFTDERIWLFLARDLAPVPAAPQADEVLEVVRVPLETARRMALDGSLTDAKTICALLRAWEVLRDAEPRLVG